MCRSRCPTVSPQLPYALTWGRIIPSPKDTWKNVMFGGLGNRAASGYLVLVSHEGWADVSHVCKVEGKTNTCYCSGLNSTSGGQREVPALQFGRSAPPLQPSTGAQRRDELGEPAGGMGEGRQRGEPFCYPAKSHPRREHTYVQPFKQMFDTGGKKERKP